MVPLLSFRFLIGQLVVLDITILLRNLLASTLNESIGIRWNEASQTRQVYPTHTSPCALTLFTWF